MKREDINKDKTSLLYGTEYVKLYDLNFMKDQHYYFASRKQQEDLAVKKDEKQLEKSKADGVGCVLIVNGKLYLNYEYRLPVGQNILSVPAGMVEKDEDILTAAKREIKEETGLTVDSVELLAPLMFSSPGLTDESNAMVLAYCHDISQANQDKCEESECFSGYALLDKDEVKKIIKNRHDGNYNFYSVYTIVAMLYYLCLDILWVFEKKLSNNWV